MLAGGRVSLVSASCCAETHRSWSTILQVSFLYGVIIVLDRILLYRQVFKVSQNLSIVQSKLIVQYEVKKKKTCCGPEMSWNVL